MMFIVTLIGMLIERFFDWGHLRNWNWYYAYQRYITERLGSKSAYLLLAINVIPLVILVALIDFLLGGFLYGFIQLLFRLFIFLYCLGPQNLWAETYACINAIRQNDITQLKNICGITNTSDTQSLHRQLLSHIFVSANHRVFAIIFWFALLGPAFALLYRLVDLSASKNAELQSSVRTIENILDWVPARIFTFIFALGGHFVQVLSVWRKHVWEGLSSNEILLTECGFAALSSSDKLPPEDGSAENEALSLLDRVFIIVLVILAIAVLLI